MSTPDTIMESTAGALQHWDLEPVLTVVPATSGTMNETFLVTTDRRRLVLRKHRRTQRDQITFEHAVIAHARNKQIPTPALVTTADGTAVVQHAGSFFSLFSFARGDQLPRGRLTRAHARSMGMMLARLDLALADFPLTPEPVPDRPPDLAPVVATVDQLLGRIERLNAPTEQDRWAADLLRSKAIWLHNATPPVWRRPPADALQLIHGDYQDANLFFDDSGAVVDVIDWDKAGSGWPPAEVVRAMDHALLLDPQLCAAFVAGYRCLRALSLDDLDHAAANWNYSRVHDHWVLEGIYLRGDDRLRIFLEPGPFVPFADRWRRLRSVLAK